MPFPVDRHIAAHGGDYSLGPGQISRVRLDAERGIARFGRLYPQHVTREVGIGSSGPSVTQGGESPKMLPPTGGASLQHLPVGATCGVERFLMPTSPAERAKIEEVEVRCSNLNYVLARPVNKICKAPRDSLTWSDARVSGQNAVMHGQLRSHSASAPSVCVNAVFLRPQPLVNCPLQLLRFPQPVVLLSFSPDQIGVRSG